MGDLIQFVLPLVGIVVAIILFVSLVQLFAIRKSLEALVKQGRKPVPGRFEEDSYQASAASRPAVVSPPLPPPAAVEQTRFGAPEQIQPASRPLVISPPPPAPVAVEQTRFEEAPQQPLTEEVPDQAVPPEEASDEVLPAYLPATVSPPPLTPAEPKTSRLPVVIGIVVLVCAIGFLAFLVLYTK